MGLSPLWSDSDFEIHVHTRMFKYFGKVSDKDSGIEVGLKPCLKTKRG